MFDWVLNMSLGLRTNEIIQRFAQFSTICAFVQIVKSTRGRVILLVHLQVEDSNTPPWLYFTHFKLHKWYQIS